MTAPRSKLLLLLAVFFYVHAYPQKAKLAAADKKYEQYSYIDAIAIYEQVAKKGYKSVELFEKLGNAYYFNSEFEKAAIWYNELFSLNQDVEPEYYFRFSQSLKSIGSYDRASEMMAIFSSKSANDSRAKIYVSNTDYLEKIKENSGRFNIKNAGLNSPQSDYGAAFFGDDLVFTTARDTGGPFVRKMKWSNQAFSNLYASKAKVDGSMAKPEKFTNILNSKFNEASAVFTKDQKTMYFTRNNYTDGKKGRSKDRRTLLKLYRATFDEIEWIDVEELDFNSDQFSCAHPALSPNDRVLYFASDMPGGYGQSDLYKINVYTDGTFGKPENLGPKINTEGKETFPFVSDDNELYFSSDGHPGLGGLDVFVSKITDDGEQEEVLNLGEPLNSGHDDFAFMIDSKSRNGFFSSNRPGGLGSDDIYRFTETRKITCEQVLEGYVTDEETGDFLGNAQVVLLDSNFNIIKEMYAGELGNYQFNVLCDRTYYLRASKLKHETREVDVMIPKEYGKTTVNIALGKRNLKFAKGDDVAPKLGIRMIYFDLDKSDIRPEAAVELQKVLVLMQANPKLKIDIRSHTDSRQTKKYNLRLSERRAKATMNWLIRQGIAASRLTAKGYGESQLINKCRDGVECTEAEHQQNRRSQFIVTDM
ncbi:flagellar motor protein MotB [Flavobacterium magnum]|uniref:Flagellar motor protein MotB n=1 Tax=Flavobacterium magnum TaxID=2162713 RepID=A0A2S0RAM8_9FLAO|nr:OmpA family protein [Flavobacterium magnum]AWA28614.1 flagellar motor protein MotB [Flavobacterium magnum]